MGTENKNTWLIAFAVFDSLPRFDHYVAGTRRRNKKPDGQGSHTLTQIERTLFK